MRCRFAAVFLTSIVAALLALASLTPPAPAGPAEPREEPLAAEVRAAILKGKAFLRRQQTNGAWDVKGLANTLYPRGGTIGLALLAILTCGANDGDDRAAVNAGLEILRGIRPKLTPDRKLAPEDDSQTYAVGLQTMVYALAGHPEDQQRIQENVDWILAARNPANGGWSYAGRPAPQTWDASNTQYALLALHEGIRAGAHVDRKVLESIRDFYLKNQKPDGGWSYRPGYPPSMTMTTAGVCGLLITGMDLEAGKQKLRDDGSAENCGVYDDDTPVAKGLAWIGDRFPAEVQSVGQAEQKFATIVEQQVGISAPFYGFYGIERTGRLSGQRFIGGHDWYRVGCKFLVATQRDDGAWSGKGVDGQEVVATSFALLFLGKGLTPVLMTKLAYGQRGDNDWNHKHNDLRHLVDFAGRELFKKQPMAWQVFDIRERVAENDAAVHDLTEQLLESPIVYFSGHDDVPTGAQVNLLKQYLENGGFVFAEACCHSADFDRKFRALMKEMYPNATLEPLDPNHPIYSASGKFITDVRRFPLEGIQQGCKTLVVYSPNAISGYWEADDTTSENGKKAFEAACNVIAYATGLEPPRQKLDSVKIVEKEPPQPKRGYLEVAQLRHGGEWKPAPKAMHNLMSAARAIGLDVVLDSKATEEGVDPADESLTRYRFLYMHGRGAFSYTGPELDHLRFDLEMNRGTLLADACCGNKEFDDSFRKLMDELWANAKDKPKLEAIPPDDPLFGAALNGKAIDYVMCRRETPDGKGVEPEFKRVKPALEGVKIDGRWAVIYSRYDIGCALERHPTPGCLGHDYPSAVALGRAAVLYALQP